MDMNTFLNANWQTQNGILIRDLVDRVTTDFGDIPEPYMEFLGDVGKRTSVSGYLQCTRPDTLQILQVIYNLN